MSRAILHAVRRRGVLAAAVLGLFAWIAGPASAQAPAAPLKIGIIGTGKIGGALARHWVKAGHEVFVSSRHPEELPDSSQELGPRAHVGNAARGRCVRRACACLDSLRRDAAGRRGLRAELAGKVIIDTSNPWTRRDGAMALECAEEGRRRLDRGAAAQHARRARVQLHTGRIARERRQPHIPSGSRSRSAATTSRRSRSRQRLVRDAGFDPVVVGSLARTREFDLGQPLASGQLTAAQLRRQIGQ